MSDYKLSVTTREGLGRGASRRLRAQGMIPAVIYGKSGNRNLAVKERDFLMLMRQIGQSAAIITLEDDQDKAQEAIIQVLQRHPVSDRFEHIDFYEVVSGQAMTTTIPVTLNGEPQGVSEGGVLDQILFEVSVTALPKDLPESIEVDVSGMMIGDTLTVGDLPYYKDGAVTFQLDAESAVATVKYSETAAVAEAADESGAEEAAEVPTVAETEEAAEGEEPPAES